MSERRKGIEGGEPDKVEAPDEEEKSESLEAVREQAASIIDLALSKVKAEQSDKILPNYRGSNREALVAEEAARLAKTANDPRALGLFKKALDLFAQSRVDLENPETIYRGAINMASEVAATGGETEVDEALQKVLQACQQMFTPETFYNLTVAKMDPPIVGKFEDGATKYGPRVYLPANQRVASKLVEKLPDMPLQDQWYGKGPKTGSSEYHLKDIIYKQMPLAVNGFARAAVLAHNLNRPEMVETFLMSAKACAQFPKMSTKQVMKGEWSYEEQVPLSDPSGLRIAEALNQIGRHEEGFEMQLRHWQHNEFYLKNFCDSAITLLESDPENLKILNFIQNFLEEIDKRPKNDPDHYANLVQKTKLQIAAILMGKFNSPEAQKKFKGTFGEPEGSEE